MATQIVKKKAAEIVYLTVTREKRSTPSWKNKIVTKVVYKKRGGKADHNGKTLRIM